MTVLLELCLAPLVSPGAPGHGHTAASLVWVQPPDLVRLLKVSWAGSSSLWQQLVHQVLPQTWCWGSQCERFGAGLSPCPDTLLQTGQQWPINLLPRDTFSISC